MSLKNVKKGDNVILKGFTGIKLGVFPVEKATDKSITIIKKDGSKMIFDKKTGKQQNVEEGKEKYANSIMEDDGSYVAPNRAGAKKKSKKTEDEKPAKKSKKKAEPVEEPEEEEDEDDIEDDDDDFEDVDEDEEDEE